MDPETATTISTLIIAVVALGVAGYATYLSKQTGVVLEGTKKVLTGTKEVLENQQCALMAMGEVLGGADFSKIFLFTLFNQSKVREAERSGTLEDLRLSQTGELYFEADGDPADRKVEKPDEAEEQTTKEDTSPPEPPSADVPPPLDGTNGKTG
jgi:hypothetical protein